MIRIGAFTYEGSVVVPYPGEWVVSLAWSTDDELPAELYPSMAFVVTGVLEGNDSTVVEGLVGSGPAKALPEDQQASETVTETIDVTGIDRAADGSSVAADAGDGLTLGAPQRFWAAAVVSGVVLGAWWFRRRPQDDRVLKN